MSSLELALRADLAGDLVDADGRPVGELASERYAQTPTRVVRCPFHDRREGQPMNASALKQLREVWPDILQAAASLAGSSGSGVAAWRAAIALTAAPTLHALLRPGVPVPNALSAGYKASLGFAQVLTHLLLTVGSDLPFAQLGSGDQLLAFLDREGWLLGESQACAGTPEMIVALWESLAGRPGGAPLPEAWASVGLPGRVPELAMVEALRIGEVLHGARAGRCAWLAAASRFQRERLSAD